MKRPEHCFANAKTQKFECRNCGEEIPLPTPCRLETFVAIGNAFTKVHKSCLPGSGGKREGRTP